MRYVMNFVVFLLFLASSGVGVAQAEEEGSYKKGQLIIQLKKGAKIEQYLTTQAPDIGLRSIEQLCPVVNSYLVSYDTTLVSAQGAKNLIFSSDKGVVLNAQFDHYLKLRSTDNFTVVPNDSFYQYQWNMHNPNNGINAEKAWYVSTGGVTALGDTIVIAIVDNGFMRQHPDIVENVWVNHNEIEGDLIDNDGNGYIDDVYGWDAVRDTSVYPTRDHGTHVAGIAGAKGNNLHGIAGVNWNVKLMLVAGAKGPRTLEHTMHKAYSYVLRNRMLYDSTNGQKGAFVVATNTSIGLDSVFCGNTSVWNATYDTLGWHGIISVVATSNIKNLNVDVWGDLPSTCNSVYVVGVTNIDKYGQLQAGYGPTHVDLAAPGTWITSAVTYGYDSWVGTSMACPHVTGAIALMHSVASESLATAYKNNPDVEGLRFRQWLLDAVAPRSSLQNKTVTGGILDLYGAVMKTPKDIEVTFANDVNGSHPGNLVVDGDINNPIPSGSQLVFGENQLHTVRTDELPVFSNTNWMHHHWGVLNPEYLLNDTFVTTVFNPEQTAVFKETVPVNIQTDIYGGKKGIIQLRDPWNYYQTGGQWQQSNVFTAHSSPLDEMLFLGESGPPSWLEPSYELKAASQQFINFYGENFLCNFKEWSGHPDSVMFETATPQTKVMIKKPGAVIRAVYESNFLTDSSFSGNGRQICSYYAIGGGQLVFVYEKEDQIYLLEYDETYGGGWEWSDAVKISQDGYKNSNPSITGSNISGLYCAAWQRTNSSSGLSEMVYLTDAYPPTGIKVVPGSQTTNGNLQPFVSVTGNAMPPGQSYFMFCFKKNNMLYYWDSFGALSTAEIIPNTNGASWPTMTSSQGGYFGFTTLAYEQGGDIKLLRFGVEHSPSLGWGEENVSILFSPPDPIQNKRPSLAYGPPGQGGLFVVWDGVSAGGNRHIYSLIGDGFPGGWHTFKEIDNFNGNSVAPVVGCSGYHDMTVLFLNSGLLAHMNWHDGGYSWVASEIEQYSAPETKKVNIAAEFSLIPLQRPVVAYTEHINPAIVRSSGAGSGVFQNTTTTNINAGWNLLGLPLKPANSYYLDLYSNAIPNSCFGWNGAYFAQDSLEIGAGYWLKFPAADTVALPGQPRDTLNLSLIPGWNLISGGVNDNIALTDVNDPSGIIIPGTLFGLNGAYYQADTIKQGHGYWLKTSAAGQITLNSGQSAAPLTKKSVPLDLSQSPVLHISDDSGTSQSLWFNVDVDQPEVMQSYSLPPLPPNGAFDARFSGDFLISENDEAVIRIQASRYPVQISASGLQPAEGFRYVLEERLESGKGRIHVLTEGETVEITKEVKSVRLYPQLRPTANNLPTVFDLKQNYPNPFNPATTIKYQLPQASDVRLDIFNILGQRIKTLVDNRVKPGYYQVIWNGRNDASQPAGAGLYFYKIKAGDFNKTRKMLLIK